MCTKSHSLVCMFYTVVVAYSFVVCMLVGYTAVEPADRRSVTATLLAMLDLKETPANKSKATQIGGRGNPQSRVNVTTVPLYSDSVINPHPFNFTIANRDACLVGNDTDYREVFLIILVKCRPNETFDRQQIRRTWGGVTAVLGRRTRTMFLLGQTRDAAANLRLRIEDDEHSDFIQEDFIDSYSNMTYKNTMGLKWVSLFCPQVSYVLSIDSDMTLNIYNLVRRLIRMPRERFAEGNLRTDPLPHRHKSSKWYTPYLIYPEPTYAPFLNGACYAMSVDVAVAVFRESAHVRFLQWDDVFIGLVLRRIGVEPRLSPLYEQFLVTRVALRRGIGKGISHNIKHVNKYAIKIWDDVVGKQLRNESGVSPFTLALLICSLCFVVFALMGCSIYLLTIPQEETKSAFFQV